MELIALLIVLVSVTVLMNYSESKVKKNYEESMFVPVLTVLNCILTCAIIIVLILAFVNGRVPDNDSKCFKALSEHTLVLKTNSRGTAKINLGKLKTRDLNLFIGEEVLNLSLEETVR